MCIRDSVWAAWVLGLRLGDQLTKELAPQWRKEPDAGVRRHLLVVLAGAGQRDGLAAIAQADPDEHVRASAVRLLLQTARPEQLAATVAQLIDFSRCDRHPLVVERILELLEARWPAARRDVLLSLLGARALGVRQAALRALRGSELLDTTAPRVLEQAFAEPDLALRRSMYRDVVEVTGGQHVGAALERAPLEHLEDVLDALTPEQRFEWHELKRLAEVGSPDLEVQLLRLLRDPASADLEFLVTRAMAAITDQAPTRTGYVRQQLGDVARSVLASRSDSPSLTPSQRERIERLAHALEQERQSLDPELFDLDGEGSFDTWQASLDDLRAGLTRLLG